MKRIFRIFVIDDRTNIRLYDLGVFKAETPEGLHFWHNLREKWTNKFKKVE